jgi:hypothetical protein
MKKSIVGSIVGPIVGPNNGPWVARVVAKCLEAHLWAAGRTYAVRTDSETYNYGGDNLQVPIFERKLKKTVHLRKFTSSHVASVYCVCLLRRVCLSVYCESLEVSKPEPWRN